MYWTILIAILFVSSIASASVTQEWINQKRQSIRYLDFDCSQKDPNDSYRNEFIDLLYFSSDSSYEEKKDKITKFIRKVNKDCPASLQDRMNRNVNLLSLHLISDLEYLRFYENQFRQGTDADAIAAYREQLKLIENEKRIQAWYSPEELVNIGTNAEERFHSLKQIEKEKNCTRVGIKSPVLDEPRNQDTFGWCWAFTAADMISFKIGKKVSAVDVANAYIQDRYYDKKSQKEKVLNTLRSWLNPGRRKKDAHENITSAGGKLPFVLESVGKRGVCLEEDLPAEDIRYSDPNLYHTVKEAKGLYKLINDIADVRKEDQKTYCSVRSRVLDMFPKLSERELEAILGKNSTQKVLKKISDSVCRGKRIPIPNNFTLHAMANVYGDSAEAMVHQIHQQLDQGNLVGISYYAISLFQGEEKGKGPHGSSIVGRKFDHQTGQCLLQIRNSYGTSCYGFNKFNYECHNGHIWVPAEKVKENLMGITYLK